MIFTLAVGVLALTVTNDAAPMGMERTTVSKMRMADLETSASGYVYNQQQGLPVSYVQYTNHGSGHYYHAPDIVHYVVGATAPVASVVETAPGYVGTRAATPDIAGQSYAAKDTASYDNEQLPRYALPSQPVKTEPLAPYYVPEKLDEKTDDGKKDEEVEGDDGNDGDDDEEDHEDSEEDGEDEDDFGGSKGDSGTSFEAGNGNKYGSDAYSENNEKDDEGYKKQEEFSKGEQGKHDSENEKGFYDIEGGNKKGYIDTAGKYGSSFDDEKNVEGNSYGEESYHKKGQKTKGYHNMYHKDEYKKDTDFYDDAHKEGHFEKYGDFNEHHKAAEGGFKKGGQHSSGFDNKEKGKKGHYNKGHHDSHDQGHKSEDGEKSYYNNEEEYAADKGSNEAKKYKFNKE